MRVIAVMNQKGGVGKTTTTLNLAHAFALGGAHVMAIDMDPQSHLTASFGVIGAETSGMDDVLVDSQDIESKLMKVRPGVSLVPAGARLGEVETLSEGGVQRGWKLGNALRKIPDIADIVLIDCPPSAGLLGINAMFAAGEILIPVSSDYLALHGFSRMIGILEHIDTALKRKTKKWVVVTRFNERRRLANEVREKLIQYFPDQVLPTAVHETVALAESPSYGKTIFEYQAKGRGAVDYSSLADNLLQI